MPRIRPHRVIQICGYGCLDQPRPLVDRHGFRVAETSQSFRSCKLSVTRAAHTAKWELNNVIPIQTRTSQHSIGHEIDDHEQDHLRRKIIDRNHASFDRVSHMREIALRSGRGSRSEDTRA